MSVDPDSTAGGFLCIWNPHVFQLSGSCCNKRFILLSCALYNSFDCVLLNVYATDDVSSRSILWNSIIKLKDSFPNPWCLGGDLNEIRHMEEKEAQKWSRIDRIKLSPEWLIHFKMKLWGLPRLISDQCLLLMMEDERDWGPKPFKFINAWTLHPNFSHLFISCWENTTITSWAAKLKASEEELHALDIIVEERVLLDLEKARRREVRGEVWKLYRRVEWLWHQQYPE
ncbi:hypothetical protein ACSBR1_008995 [Camellia fascicularis]